MSDGVNVAKLDNVLRDGYLTLAVGWANSCLACVGVC